MPGAIYRNFRDYNNNKIKLMLGGMRYYGGVVSSGSSGRQDIRNGRAEKELNGVSFPLGKSHDKDSFIQSGLIIRLFPDKPCDRRMFH